MARPAKLAGAEQPDTTKEDLYNDAKPVDLASSGYTSSLAFREAQDRNSRIDALAFAVSLHKGRTDPAETVIQTANTFYNYLRGDVQN